MPSLLVSVATTNFASWPSFGVTSTRAEIILALMVSKVASLISECTTRPSNDFRHASVNGAGQYAKREIHLRVNGQKATEDLTCFCVFGKCQSFTTASFDEDVRIMPLSTIKSRHPASRLALKQLSIF